MKTNYNKIVLEVIGIIIFLFFAFYLLNFFGLLNKTSNLASVPIDTNYINTSSSFTCPSDVAFCKVKGAMLCNVQKTEGQQVVMRTNIASDSELANSGSWIAYDEDLDRSLSGFNYANSFCKKDESGLTYNLNLYSTDSSKKFIGLSNKNVYVAYDKSTGSFKGVALCNNYISSTCGNHQAQECTICDSGNDWHNQLISDYGEGAIVECTSEHQPTTIKWWKACWGEVQDSSWLQCWAYTNPTNSFITDTLPVSPYKDDGREITIGQKPYQCSAHFDYVIRGSGQKSFESKSYSGDYPSQLIPFSPVEIAPGTNANITGNDDVWIQYQRYQDITTCTEPKGECAGTTGFYPCVGGHIDYENLEYCDINNGFVCDNGACSPPFESKDILIADTYGTEKTGFTQDETIIVKTKLVSKTISSGTVNILVYKYGELSPSQTKTINNYNFAVSSTVSNSITNPGLGSYYVRIQVTANGQTFNVGEDEGFRVSIPVSCTLYLKSASGSSKILVNSPAYLELNAFATGAKPDIEKINFSAKFKNSPFSISPDGYEGTPAESTRDDGSQVVTYRYPIIFSETGLFDVSATVEMGGVRSNACTIANRMIESLTLTTTLQLGTCVKYGATQEILFEVKDNYGQYVDTSNILKVTEPGSVQETDISSTINRIDKGKYKFAYTFSKKGGYKFYLTSSSPEYQLASSPVTGTPESNENCNPSECVSNQYCIEKYGSNYICSGGKCVIGNKSNWIMYLLIGGGILAFIVLIIIVTILMKRKKSTDLGFGGL